MGWRSRYWERKALECGCDRRVHILEVDKAEAKAPGLDVHVDEAAALEVEANLDPTLDLEKVLCSVAVRGEAREKEHGGDGASTELGIRLGSGMAGLEMELCSEWAGLETGLCHSKSVELEMELYHTGMAVRGSMLCIERAVQEKVLYYDGIAARARWLGIGKGELEMALYTEREEREMVLCTGREEREMVLDGYKVLARAI